MGHHPPLWHEQEYTSKRQSALSVACVGSNGVSCDNCLPNSGKLYMGKAFDCELYPEWNNLKHLPHQPQDLVVNKTTGVVQWETGVDPFNVDYGTYQSDFDANADGDLNDAVDGTKDSVPFPLKQPLDPGFYNLVLDIRSNSHDPCLEMEPPTCEFDDPTGHISIPLDVLLYLYPPMRMCHGDCGNSGSETEVLNGRQGVSTFQDPAGYYGHLDSTSPPDKWVHDSPGSGACALCGGGDASAAMVYNPDVCEPSSGKSCQDYEIDGILEQNHTCRMGTADCCPGVLVPATSATPTTNARSVYDDFLAIHNGGAAYNRSCHEVQPVPTLSFSKIIPAYGSCYVNTAPSWVDGDSCIAVQTDTPPVDADVTLSSGPTARIVATRGSDIAFDLVAKDDDPCSELSIEHTGLADGMTIMEHTRDYASQVRRKFYWNATTAASTDVSLDTRPTDASVCFYPFDNYIAGSMRCVQMVIPTCFEFRDSKILSSPSSQQLVSFRLFDCEGGKVRHLSCDSFVAAENSVAVDTLETSLQCLQPYQAYLILLDLSGSVVASSTMLGFVRQSAREFITKLYDHQCYNSELLFSIHGLAGDLTSVEILPFQSSKDVVLEALDSLTSPDSLFEDYRPRNLYGAVGHALEVLDNKTLEWSANTQHVTSHLAIFTAGEDTTGYTSLADTVSAISSSSHEVFAIGLSEQTSLSDATLNGLGTNSGKVYRALTQEQMQTTATELAEYVQEKFSNTYVIAYCSPRRKGTHTLGVSARGQTSGTAISFEFDAAVFVNGSQCNAPSLQPSTPSPSTPSTFPPPPPPPPPPPITTLTPNPPPPPSPPPPPPPPKMLSIYDEDSSLPLTQSFLEQASNSMSKAVVTNITLLSTESAMLSLYGEFVEDATNSRRKLTAIDEMKDLLELVISFETGIKSSNLELAFLEFVANNKMKISVGFDPDTPSMLAQNLLRLEESIVSGEIATTLLEYEVSIIPEFHSENKFVVSETYMEDNLDQIKSGLDVMQTDDKNKVLTFVSSQTSKDFVDVVNSSKSSGGSSSGGSSKQIYYENWFYIVVGAVGGILLITISGLLIFAAIERGQQNLVKEFKKHVSDAKEELALSANSPDPKGKDQKQAQNGGNGTDDIEKNINRDKLNNAQDATMTTKEDSEEEKPDSPYVSDSEIIHDRDIDEHELQLIEDDVNGDHYYHHGYEHANQPKSYEELARKQYYENQRRL